MTKAQNIQAIEQATERLWAKWEQWLNGKGAQELSHKQIAELVHDELVGTSLDNPGWWAQGVTVAYEQAIGRRAPGQRSDGTFEVSASKTVARDRDTLFGEVVHVLGAARDFDGQTISNVRTSTTPIRSYWKCNLADGSKITVAIEAKAADKSLLVITQAGLPSIDVAAAAKSYWQSYLAAMSIG